MISAGDCVESAHVINMRFNVVLISDNYVSWVPVFLEKVQAVSKRSGPF